MDLLQCFRTGTYPPSDRCLRAFLSVPIHPVNIPAASLFRRASHLDPKYSRVPTESFLLFPLGFAVLDLSILVASQ